MMFATDNSIDSYYNQINTVHTPARAQLSLLI